MPIPDLHRVSKYDLCLLLDKENLDCERKVIEMSEFVTPENRVWGKARKRMKGKVMTDWKCLKCQTLNRSAIPWGERSSQYKCRGCGESMIVLYDDSAMQYCIAAEDSRCATRDGWIWFKWRCACGNVNSGAGYREDDNEVECECSSCHNKSTVYDF